MLFIFHVLNLHLGFKDQNKVWLLLTGQVKVHPLLVAIKRTF
jgi:hypothetical protein